MNLFFDQICMKFETCVILQGLIYSVLRFLFGVKLQKFTRKAKFFFANFEFKSGNAEICQQLSRFNAFCGKPISSFMRKNSLNRRKFTKNAILQGFFAKKWLSITLFSEFVKKIEKLSLASVFQMKFRSKITKIQILAKSKI